ncbi:hypothetical protein BDR22DRAFT_882065 [Usnea florida]
MDKMLFERFDGSKVTESMLQEASQLFSEHYGVWGEQAAQALGKFAKAGSHVRLSKERLRAEYLPDDTCSYVKVTVDGCLAGNAFACRWSYDNKIVCWITQLVVHQDFRERGLAMSLLNQLRQKQDDVYCLMSSHPAACLAAAKAYGGSINAVRLDFIKEHAERIMKESPIRYVKDAKLRGSLFNPEDASGLVSSVDTDFWVDHTEPLEALAWVRDKGDWPLGDLVDGHEFLLVMDVRRRTRSKFRSSSGS